MKGEVKIIEFEKISYHMGKVQFTVLKLIKSLQTKYREIHNSQMGINSIVFDEEKNIENRFSSVSLPWEENNEKTSLLLDRNMSNSIDSETYAT